MSLSVGVPFVKIGNRRCLTDKQLVEYPWLEDFVNRFKHCFERDPILSVWIFIEKDVQ